MLGSAHALNNGWAAQQRAKMGARLEVTMCNKKLSWDIMSSTRSPTSKSVSSVRQAVPAETYCSLSEARRLGNY